MAWDRYQRTGRGDTVSVDFYTGMPSMFSVKKYSDALNALRQERGVGGHFAHNLVGVNADAHKATFKTADGTVDVDYTLLHVSPPMGPLDALKGSPISDEAGWVSVDKATLRHTNADRLNARDGGSRGWRAAWVVGREAGDGGGRARRVAGGVNVHRHGHNIFRARPKLAGVCGHRVREDTLACAGVFAGGGARWRCTRERRRDVCGSAACARCDADSALAGRSRLGASMRAVQISRMD